MCASLTSTLNTQQLLADACEALERSAPEIKARPLEAPALAPSYVDGAVEIEFPDGREIVIAAAVHPRLDPSLLLAAHRLHKTDEGGGEPLLFVAPWVSPKTAASLIHLGIPFLDAAGNAYIDRPGAIILIRGNPKPAGISMRPTSKASTPQGLVVTYTLLTNPEALRLPLRQISAISGTALSTVDEAIRDLVKNGQISIRSDGARVFIDRPRAIQEWMSNYSARLRPRLGALRFDAPTGDWWKSFDFGPHQVHIGGEAAAELLAGGLKARTLTLYCRPESYKELIRAAKLRASPTGATEILEPFWPRESDPVSPEGEPPLVHPLLVCADLVRTGDSRNLEAAQEIHDHFLRNP